MDSFFYYGICFCLVVWAHISQATDCEYVESLAPQIKLSNEITNVLEHQAEYCRTSQVFALDAKNELAEQCLRNRDAVTYYHNSCVAKLVTKQDEAALGNALFRTKLLLHFNTELSYLQRFSSKGAKNEDKWRAFERRWSERFKKFAYLDKDPAHVQRYLFQEKILDFFSAKQSSVQRDEKYSSLPINPLYQDLLVSAYTMHQLESKEYENLLINKYNGNKNEAAAQITAEKNSLVALFPELGKDKKLLKDLQKKMVSFDAVISNAKLQDKLGQKMPSNLKQTLHDNLAQNRQFVQTSFSNESFLKILKADEDSLLDKVYLLNQEISQKISNDLAPAKNTFANLIGQPYLVEATIRGLRDPGQQRVLASLYCEQVSKQDWAQKVHSYQTDILGAIGGASFILIPAALVLVGPGAALVTLGALATSVGMSLSIDQAANDVAHFVNVDSKWGVDDTKYVEYEVAKERAWESSKNLGLTFGGTALAFRPALRSSAMRWTAWDNLFNNLQDALEVGFFADNLLEGNYAGAFAQAGMRGMFALSSAKPLRIGKADSSGEVAKRHLRDDAKFGRYTKRELSVKIVSGHFDSPGMRKLLLEEIQDGIKQYGLQQVIDSLGNGVMVEYAKVRLAARHEPNFPELMQRMAQRERDFKMMLYNPNPNVAPIFPDEVIGNLPLKDLVSETLVKPDKKKLIQELQMGIDRYGFSRLKSALIQEMQCQGNQMISSDVSNRVDTAERVETTEKQLLLILEGFKQPQPAWRQLDTNVKQLRAGLDKFGDYLYNQFIMSGGNYDLFQH